MLITKMPIVWYTFGYGGLQKVGAKMSKIKNEKGKNGCGIESCFNKQSFVCMHYFICMMYGWILNTFMKTLHFNYPMYIYSC